MSTTTAPPANATALLIDRHIAETKGNRAALRFGDKRYAYHDLAALVNRAGNMLRRLGVEEGDDVLLAVSPSPALLASLLGAIKIGACAVIMPKDAALDAAAERHPKLIIADAGRLSGLGDAKIPVLAVGGASPPHPSFLEAMRESASSLARVAVAADAAALALVPPSAPTITHGEIAAAADGAGRVIAVVDGWDLGSALQRLARCEEVTIP